MILDGNMVLHNRVKNTGNSNNMDKYIILIKFLQKKIDYLNKNNNKGVWSL